jgi:hypothetical protein
MEKNFIKEICERWVVCTGQEAIDEIIKARENEFSRIQARFKTRLWLNGDIDYAIDAPYFTILFEDEDDSEQYGDQVNIGVITTPLSEIAILEGSYDVRIELAEE